MKDTCVIGRETQAKALTFFISKGYIVSLPFGGQARYDLLVDTGVNILRIQVKTGSFKDGCIVFYSASSHYIKGSHIHTTYSKKEIDYFLTEYDNIFYLVPVEECGKEKRLRIEPPKNGSNSSNINWAKNYLAEEVLKNL